MNVGKSRKCFKYCSGHQWSERFDSFAMRIRQDTVFNLMLLDLTVSLNDS